MKKIIIMSFVILAAVLLVYNFADAVITGRCDQCHTMHNSQENARMAKNFDGSDSETSFGHLTRSSCTGCHNGVLDTNAPNIFGTVSRTAGGTFAASVVGSSPKQVHNVRDLTWTVDEVAQPTGLLDATPGAESGGFTEPIGANELTCAGSKGCHGNHNVAGSDAGIRGFHHGTYDGYRYLRFYDGTNHTAILGKGSSDWELNGATASNHNVYFAMNGINATTNDSISALCALCHGDFHGGTDVYTGGAFVRHPTENLLSDALSWDLNEVTVDYEANPFGFNGAAYSSASPTLAYTTSGARVVCVSCHRAHGSGYNDILRFDYATMEAGSNTVTTGCLGCHHLQRQQ